MFSFIPKNFLLLINYLSNLRQDRQEIFLKAVIETILFGLLFMYLYQKTILDLSKFF